MRFYGWVPNILGHISFSLIGIPHQPRKCGRTNFVAYTAHHKRPTRVIVCQQVRNLSDNLLFFWADGAIPSLHHSFVFTVCAQSYTKNHDKVGVLSGWITVHTAKREKNSTPAGPAPTEIDLLKEGFREGLRRTQRELIASSEFAVAFRLCRSGTITLLVPKSARQQVVQIADQEHVPEKNALRSLSAQCFYFLRDISHKHYHHSPRTDTMTSVWAEDGGDSSSRGRWARETLYELHKRVLMLRSVRFAQAQENALGILAYADAFEKHIAKNLRNVAGHTYIPNYDSSELKSSISWTLESKRRLRIQQNVAAAALPAITFTAILLANAITPQNLSDQQGVVYWLISLIRENQLLLAALYVAAIYFVLSLTGIAPSPRRLWPVKILVQLFAAKGRWSALIVHLFAAALTAFIVWALT